MRFAKVPAPAPVCNFSVHVLDEPFGSFCEWIFANVHAVTSHIGDVCFRARCSTYTITFDSPDLNGNASWTLHDSLKEWD